MKREKWKCKKEGYERETRTGAVYGKGRIRRNLRDLEGGG